VLDPEVEAANWMVPASLRDTLAVSTTRPILPHPPAGKPQPRPPEHIYGEEIARGWCYYYEQADLARQVGDWERVTALGEAAFASSDYALAADRARNAPRPRARPGFERLTERDNL
jgi:hypothetical protein